MEILESLVSWLNKVIFIIGYVASATLFMYCVLKVIAHFGAQG